MLAIELNENEILVTTLQNHELRQKHILQIILNA